MPLIDLIAGARPNFVKIASIVKALDRRPKSAKSLKYRLVHTGQHYSSDMSDTFFKQLGIPEPDINLKVGSGTQSEQAAAIMTRYEKLLVREPSDLCLVVGDVNSTFATAITARKMGIQVAHVEAGIRSGDWSMPEEINRVVTDSITNLFFTTSDEAGKNLVKSGIDEDQIHFVGNTMIDTLLANLNDFSPPTFWKANTLKAGGYIVLTLHRPSNVDDQLGFSNSLMVISELAAGMPVIYPAHPRTLKYLEDIPLPSNLIIVEPQPYLSFNYLVKNARAVITDSGGITEETTVMGIPCMTLRDNTERPETVSIGTNELVGSNPNDLLPYLEKLFSGNWKQGGIPEKWDGKASERIVSILIKHFFE